LADTVAKQRARFLLKLSSTKKQLEVYMKNDGSKLKQRLQKKEKAAVKYYTQKEIDEYERKQRAEKERQKLQ